MPTIDFEKLDWEDYPSTQTPLSADNLNRLEDAMEGIYDDVGGQEQAISNILGNFAYVEPTAVASKDYLAGDLLVRGDYMYKAIIPIQTDEALVEGTNITKTTVSSELGVDVFSNFAYIERSNVATKNYTVGSHVLLNNILYVVTSAVETGENLVVDMNIEQTTVCDELEKETGSVASAVGYDNTTSGLTATNVQDAVDELASSAADGVFYDNTESGLTATNVQDAVDEVTSSINNAVDTLINNVSRIDYRELTRETVRAYNETGNLGTVTLSKGVYIAFSQSTTDSGYSGRAYCDFTGSGVSIIDFVPPTMPTGYGNIQITQLIVVTSSQTVSRRYWDTQGTGAKHIWQIYRIL